MSEKRFISEYVEIIDENGSRQAVCVTDKEHTVSLEVKDEYVAIELCDLLNEQQDTIKNLYDEIHSLKKIIKEQTLRVYCQDQEIQKLTRQLQKIPPNIRDVWLE